MGPRVSFVYYLVLLLKTGQNKTKCTQQTSLKTPLKLTIHEYFDTDLAIGNRRRVYFVLHGAQADEIMMFRYFYCAFCSIEKSPARF